MRRNAEVAADTVKDLGPQVFQTLSGCCGTQGEQENVSRGVGRESLSPAESTDAPYRPGFNAGGALENMMDHEA